MKIYQAIFRAQPKSGNFIAHIMLLFATMFWGGIAAQATPVNAGYSSVELVSEQRFVRAGEKASFGLRLKPQKTWHTYWVNPGDAGKSIEVVWDNPEGMTIGPMQFPTPHLVPFMGLVSYGYSEDILVIFDVFIPPKFKGGDNLRLGGIANWLACDDKLCVPQQADVKIDFVVGKTGIETVFTQEFDTARNKIPTRVDWPAIYGSYGDDGVLFHIDIPTKIADGARLELYPVAKKIVDHATLTRADINKEGVGFLAKAGSKLKTNLTSDLVIVAQQAGEDRRAYRVTAQAGDLSALKVTERMDTPRQTNVPALGEARPKTSMSNVLGAIVFSLIGGFLLNLMPCVLPILSLKALGLVKLSNEELSTARKNGLAYTAGILASFLAFALVLAALRSAGSYAGWGFQMQHPVVLVTLILLMGAIGANLAGLFEFTSRFASFGQNMTRGTSLRAEFFTGVLAVVVAAPCTAPFMAGALGYALTQPLIITILVFLGLGLGLAMPYLLLCYFPRLRNWMPKPGAWMRSFKQFLAFPMFATALWLLWVLGNQVGLEYVLGVLVLALLFAMAVWAIVKGGGSSKKILWNIFAGIILGASLWTAAKLPSLKAVKQISAQIGKLSAQPYSLTKLENLLANDQPVFLYFTADWCITCKVNEKVALYKPEVIAGFKDKNIQILVGDWTNPDDEIAKILKRFGRIGVPLYLYYPAGTQSVDDAKILPQILTSKIILDTL